jgi:serine/threonine protein kinase
MPATNKSLHQGRYQIIREFCHEDSCGGDGDGGGSGAIIYEARDNVLGTKVAVRENLIRWNKVATAAQREAHRLAFVGEAQTLTALNHEAFLRVRDYFSDIDRQYLVTEAIESEDLARLVEKNKRPFSLSEVGAWTDQLLDALNFLHTRVPAIIFRDLKPQNVTLSAGGRVKIFPFAAAAAAMSGGALKNQSAENPAALPYLPLEQIWDGLDPASQKVILNSYDEKSERILESPPDARGDIYSLGATVYFLLTARPPVDALTRSIELLEGQPDPLHAPARLNPAVPSEISEIVMKALEIRREERFATAEAMRQVWRATSEKMRAQAAAAAAAEKAKMEKAVADNGVGVASSAAGGAAQAPAEKFKSVSASENGFATVPPSPERRKAESEQTRTEAAARPKQNQSPLESQTQKPEVEAADSPARLTVENFAKTELTPELNQAQPESAAADADDILRSPVLTESEKPAAGSNQAGEFGVLFAEPQTNNSNFRRLAAAAAALIIFAGAGLGGWFWLKPNSAQSSRTVAADPAMSLTADAADSASGSETSTEASAMATTATSATEPKSEITTASPDSAPATVSSEPSAISPSAAAAAAAAAKNKNAAAPRVKKQLPQSAAQNSPDSSPVKTPAAPQKKPITVDDLINDN